MAQRPKANDSIDDQLEGEQEGGEHLVPKLPEDYETPFAKPRSPIEDAAEQLDIREVDGKVDPDHPQTDTNVDSHEAYDGGLSEAEETKEPNQGNAVTDYHPEE